MTSNEFASYTYDGAGRITQITEKLSKPTLAPNGTITTGATTGSPFAQVAVTYSVSYDAVGRITAFNQTAPASATLATPKTSVAFTYDANGNRQTSVQATTTLAKTGGTTAVPIFTPSTVTTTKTYQIDPAGNKLLGFSQTMTQSGGVGGGATSTASVAYTYDANGALLTDGLRHYAYDSEGRLAAASLGWASSATADDSITKYAHNSQAQRVFKTAPLFAVTNPEPTATPELLALFTAFFESLWAPSTNPDGSTVQKAGMSYVYDEDGTLIAQTLTGGATTTWGQSARYVYLPTASGPMPVAAIYGTKHYAIQSDHLNTPRRLIQSDGQVAWQWAYSAFGEEKPTIAKTRFANADLNQSFGSTTVPAVTFNLRYPGQYFDQESGLHYNYHRSYSATTGRYTQSDPIGLDGGWNRFGYANQNALSYIDPDGKAALLALCATNPAAALACAGGAVGAAAYALPGVKSGIDAIIKFCAPDDPCAALLKTVSAKAADVRRQYFANMTDAKDLYNKAYCQPDLGKRSGSWIGHEQKLRNLIESLRTAITAADAAGCAVNAEDRKLLLLEIPYCPAK